MKLTSIALSELLPYIHLAFDGDTDLPKYHIADMDYALHTYDQICETAKILDLTCYKVGEIGFTVIAPKLLYSFGIAPAYRDKKNLESWFVNLKDIMPTFEVVLHDKNSRAINHLIRQGMKIKEHLTVLRCL